MCGVVTANTALVATAASAAVPPARSMATPADEASAMKTVPTGFSAEPPSGPAMPVVASA